MWSLGTWWWFSGRFLVLGGWLDLVILRVFSDLKDPVMLMENCRDPQTEKWLHAFVLNSKHTYFFFTFNCIAGA